MVFAIKLFICVSIARSHAHRELKTLSFPPFHSCTNSQWSGCERHGTETSIINPVRSARLNTAESFSFTYGRLEVIAKLPTGDWLWPGE